MTPDPDTISPATRAALEARIAEAKAARGPRRPVVAEPPPSGSMAIVYVTPRRRRFAP